MPNITVFEPSSMLSCYLTIAPEVDRERPWLDTSIMTSILGFFSRI